MGTKLIEAPGTEPITLDEARISLRVTSAKENRKIEACIRAARGWAERFTGRALVTQTWELYLDRFPCSREIYLPLPPLQSVTHIKYLDQSGVLTTVPSSDYSVDAVSQPGRIVLAWDEAWPDTGLFPNAVVIKFVAGYGAAEVVPEDIKQAMHFVIGHLMETRQLVQVGVSVTEIPMTAEYMLWPYRMVAM